MGLCPKNMDFDNVDQLSEYEEPDEAYNSDNDLYEEDSNEGEEFAIDNIEEESENITNSDENSYQVLSTEQIVEHMVESIKEVSTILGISVTTTRILLNHFKWDKQKLLERFYSEDQEKLFEDVRIVNPFQDGSTAKQLSQHASSNEADFCEICYLSLPQNKMFELKCEHRFCTECWNVYLRTKIMEEGLSQTIACAAHDCPILVDDASVMQLITDPSVKQKYQLLITNSFVHCNRDLVWCPSPECSNAIKVKCNETKWVTCSCEHSFCFQCTNNCHEPIQCDLLRKWTKKCEDDSETGNWISANTKDCPKCNAVIEKNGGCNHISCKNINCRHQFCWICLRDWNKHSDSNGYYCNRFDDKKSTDDKKERSRAALERYLFYYNRYMNHMQSLKFEKDLYEKAQTKMEELQVVYRMSWIEVQYLKKAVQILCCCRQTLMYSYILPHYLKKNNQSSIFEDNQQDLESATECLSGYLEKIVGDEDLTCDNYIEMRQQIQDKYSYCSCRRDVLINHVKEGYEEDWWAYLEFDEYVT